MFEFEFDDANLHRLIDRAAEARYGCGWRLPLVPSGRIEVDGNGVPKWVSDALERDDRRLNELERWQKEVLKLQGYITLLSVALATAVSTIVSMALK